MDDDVPAMVNGGGPYLAIADRIVTVTTSVGIVLARAAHQRGDDLLRDADVAMYEAKRRGQGQFAIFAPEMTANTVARFDGEADLRRALAEQEFVVHYQPQIDLGTGEIIAVEALVRWQHPQRGLLHAEDFIDIAEETGLILPLGRQVLEAACRQARQWQQQRPTPPLHLRVNLSSRQLRDRDAVAQLARVLDEAGLAPGSLTLELRESGLAKEPEGARERLQQFKALGIALAIDDFGTGYSSFGYLRQLPADMVKIDRSFVAGLGLDPADDGIVQAIFTLGARLGLQVIAEGVETAEQRALLQGMGCTLGQGYFFARPQDAAAMTALLEGGPLPVAPLTLTRSA